MKRHFCDRCGGLIANVTTGFDVRLQVYAGLYTKAAGKPVHTSRAVDLCGACKQAFMDAVENVLEAKQDGAPR